MEFLQQIGLFLSQTVIIVLAIVAIILTLAGVAIKNKNQKTYDIEVLNDNYKQQAMEMKSAFFPAEQVKSEKKQIKKENKNNKNNDKPYAYVLNFLDGDVKASGVEQLREEITTLLLVAKKDEEVILNVESPGGAVHGYGLAAAQILRLREAGLKVTICVDKIAASGGYMMACTAHKIISAPFAIVGSIGVVASVPNFHKILKKNEIEYKEYTAGDYKRTVSLFGEITEKGEKKFHEQLESTHTLFKNFVGLYRPQLNLSEVATGEYWFGLDALKLKLVDEIGTSDDYILNKTKTHTVVKISQEKKKKFADKLSEMFSAAVALTLDKSLQRLENKKYDSNTIYPT